MTMKDDDHLLYDISRCLETGIPVPPRLSARFIDLVRKAYDGDFRSWDEAFGKPRLNPEKRKKFERRYDQTQKVVEAAEERKGHLNEGAFEAIGRETGIGGKTKVKELLQNHRFWVDRANRLLELGRNFSKNYRR